jgi:chloride channel 7
VLFVVEEASSFVTVQHIEKTFFASAAAYWLGWILQGAEDDFVKFASPQGPACSLYNSIDLIYFVAMGVFGGVLGSLFNHIVEHLNEHRIEHINKHHWKRVLEVVVVCLLTSVAAVFLPAMFDCVEAERHLMMDDSLGCLAKDYQDQLFRGRIMEEAAYNWMEGDIVMNNTSHPDYEYVSHLNKASKKHTYLGYDAASKHHVQFNYHAHYNCAPHEYNPMAMLWLKGGAYSVKNLFERGMPHLYELNVLIVFLVVYFFLAAISSGIAVPAGLVVPMICIGGSYGRIFGFLNMAVKKKTCAAYMESPFATSTVNSLTMAQWSHEYHSLLAECGWPDPGSYAVIGAASFMGGSGRITLFLATVMLEVTNDIKMLPPIAFAVILAMWTGNKINHGLYHALIPLAGIPFVNSDPNHIMRYKPVRELMSDTIRTISVNTTYVEIRALIQKDEITHNSFPVVNKDNKLVGLITRSKLSHVLKGDAHLDDDDDETDDMFKHDKIVGGLPVKTKKKKEPVDNSESARKRRRLVLKKMAMKSVLGAAALMKAKKGVDITHYMHRNPITVFTDTKCARAFRIFRSQGYRHLCVIDHKGEPRGMLTRKDLQVYKILEHGGGHGHH